MLVAKNTNICATPKDKPKICVTPNANTQRESVKYRLRWVSWRWVWRWQCRFHVICAHFIYVGYLECTGVSSLQWNIGFKVYYINKLTDCTIHELNFRQCIHWKTYSCKAHAISDTINVHITLMPFKEKTNVPASCPLMGRVPIPVNDFYDKNPFKQGPHTVLIVIDDNHTGVEGSYITQFLMY